jgi:hypothetical protein
MPVCITRWVPMREGENKAKLRCLLRPVFRVAYANLPMMGWQTFRGWLRVPEWDRLLKRNRISMWMETGYVVNSRVGRESGTSQVGNLQ